ncbi:uncharacterized protein K452DRAFT_236197 [Aplosporella prunicola CBS 121167]|uniref:Uncharacterized protein n=1 Tax=Aplosporella prunicola CBS 121167 TaxID=1176127 RepID=A0A6A6B3F6_9PEZI|nr:uncharacterized protein K452DRAFT_236197 [Aplosporella prunicola CBS 121167]KAF2137261.1 hypothetical protein K452DRAFT_236197 [Aplosporella prunicola CBS 121167]
MDAITIGSQELSTQQHLGAWRPGLLRLESQQFLLPYNEQVSHAQITSDASLSQSETSIPGNSRNLQNEQSPPESSSVLSKLENWWIWELLGLLVSAASLIGIIFILGKYDQERRPTWYYLSLSSLVSWLSTAAKICAFIPVSRGLGQLKWVWLAEKRRPLSDLKVFDSASRGLLGSLELLWELKCRHFAVLGAVATVLGLAFDPFIQNLVHYYDGQIQDTSQIALLTNCTTYNTRGPLMGGNFHYEDPILHANVYRAIANVEQANSWATPQYFCSSGNCTWDPIATLELRSTCKDVSERLEMECHPPMALSTTTSPLVHSNTYFPAIQLILAQGIEKSKGAGALNITKDTIFTATECILEAGVRSFQAAVNNSTYEEKALNTYSIKSKSTDASIWSPPWGPEYGMQRGQNFSIDSDTLRDMFLYLHGTFSGSVSGASDSFQFRGDQETVRAIFYGNYTDCNTPEDPLACALNNTAKAISKTFQDAAYNANGPGGASMTVGKTMVTVTFVRVSWYWISLPVFIWLLSAITWIGTAWKTRKTKVETWRNNPIPLAFLYRENAEKESVEYGISDEAYVKRAENMQVRLQVEGNKASLV